MTCKLKGILPRFLEKQDYVTAVYTTGLRGNQQKGSDFTCICDSPETDTEVLYIIHAGG